MINETLLLLENTPTLQYIMLFVFGLCVGSFLNVVIYRLPLMLHNKWTTDSRDFLSLPPETLTKVSLIYPRSSCPFCHTTIKAWQNIPLISFFILRAKCFYCKKPITSRYPFIELMTAVLSLIVLYHFGYTYQTLFGLVFTYALIALAFIDIDEQILPDEITLPLIWTGLLVNTFSLFTPLDTAVLSTVGAYLSLWLFIKLFYLITGKEGMGQGDIKLFAAFGAWLGWQVLPLIILFSSLIGAVIGVLILRFKKQDKDTPLPFGPYLCLSAFIAFIWGDKIIKWYLNFLS